VQHIESGSTPGAVVARSAAAPRTAAPNFSCCAPQSSLSFPARTAVQARAFHLWLQAQNAGCLQCMLPLLQRSCTDTSGILPRHIGFKAIVHTQVSRATAVSCATAVYWARLILLKCEELCNFRSYASPGAPGGPWDNTPSPLQASGASFLWLMRTSAQFRAHPCVVCLCCVC